MDYVGCEHVLLGLIAEPDGLGGQILRAAGAELRLTRRAVAAALAGYVHLQAQTAAGTGTGTATATAGADQAELGARLAAVVREQLAPIVARLERLEEGDRT